MTETTEPKRQTLRVTIHGYTDGEHTVERNVTFEYDLDRNAPNNHYAAQHAYLEQQVVEALNSAGGAMATARGDSGF